MSHHNSYRLGVLGLLATIDRAGLSKGGHRRGSSYKCRYCDYWHCSSKHILAGSNKGKSEI